jgi:hypothetical protein
MRVLTKYDQIEPMYLPQSVVTYISLHLYMRKYCDCEEADLEILTDLYVLSPPGYKKVIFGMLYVCVYAYIDVHVTSF